MVWLLGTARAADAQDERVVFVDELPHGRMAEVQASAARLRMWTQMPSTTTTPSEQIHYVALVDANRNPIPNRDVAWDYYPVAYTGGHIHHDDNHPKGEFEVLGLGSCVETSPLVGHCDGNTGPTGWLEVKYTAPQPAGQIAVDTYCPVTRPCGISYGYVDVLFPGLIGLNFGELIGQTATHPSNHRVSYDLYKRLYLLDIYYYDKFGSQLGFNDASLAGGGLFDISADWSPPHKSHRWGDNLDLRLVPRSHRKALATLCAFYKLAVYVEGDHWHLTVL